MEQLVWFSIGVWTTIAVYLAGRLFEDWRHRRRHVKLSPEDSAMIEESLSVYSAYHAALEDERRKAWLAASTNALQAAAATRREGGRVGSNG